MRGSIWSGAGAVVVLGGSAVLAGAPGDPGVSGAAADPVTAGDAIWTRYEWRASTYGRSAQSQASIAVDDAGNLVPVWSSRRQQGGRYGVFAQRFDARGIAVGTETSLNLWTSSHQWMPSIAMATPLPERAATESAPTAVPWVAWHSHGQDGQAGSIVARRMGAPGTTDWSGGDEILVNDEWRGHQSDPVVVAAPDGGALVVWTSTPNAADRAQVRGQRFDAAGARVGVEFGVCDDGAWHQRLPGAAFAADGTFAVVYAVSDDTPGVSGIRLQRFDANADPVGDSILVSGTPRPSQIEPVIATQGDGYLVAWLDAASDGDDYGVVAQRLDADGTPHGPAFVVNTTTTGPQTAPALAVARDGRFAVAWNGPDADGQGVFGQLFAADGRRLGGEFAVNRHTDGDQVLRTATATQRLVFTPAGALACVWSGDAGLGDDSSVNVTLLSPRPLDLGDCTQGVNEMMPPAGADDAAAAAPHEPPTFDPKRVDDAEREIRLAPGGGIGFTAVVNTGWTPPDPHLAVGPEHVVVMTNGEISIFEKDGTRIFQDEIEGGGGFWGAQGASGFIFDPEVVYDPMSERFFAMAADRNSSNGNSYALVAVSFDSTPDDTGNDWHKYRFNTTTLSGPTFDSPNIGVDANVVYVTGDGFGGPQPYPCYTFDKASLLNGDPPAIRRDFFLTTSTQSAGLPPVTFDDPPALYLIEHRESTINSAVRLIALRDPLGTPNFVTTILAVPEYGGRPEDPPQAGTSSRPNTFDARFWSVAYRDGSLWATHHINSDRVLARWYEIAMNGWPDSGDLPELVQSGDIDPGAGVRTFFSSITVDEFGNAAMCYARSSPSEFMSMETAYRYRTDPLGTFQPGEIRATATAGYPSGRWGDYSAINVDPTDGKTFWAHHEYAVGSSWRTWVEGFTPPFATGDVNCDGAVNFEDILRVLGAWGPCDGCPEDVNGNGVVDFADILVILTQWS